MTNPRLRVVVLLITGAMYLQAVDYRPCGALTALPSSPDHPNQVSYTLGPGDEIRVSQFDTQEFDGKSARLDAEGFVNLPIVGRLRLGGLTIRTAEALISTKLAATLISPNPIVNIVEYRSQPVSILGAITNPGVIQLQGPRLLTDVLSIAGGLRNDAGGNVVVTRRLSYGHLGTATERVDSSGAFSVSTISIPDLLNGTHPRENPVICPEDIVSIPLTSFVYVTGNVRKPGGFQVGVSGGLTVLQALSLAEGLGPDSAAEHSTLFHARDSRNVDIKSILSGKQNDFVLEPKDVLYIPSSTAKKIGYRAMEAAIQTVTGIVIWRR